MRSRPSSLKTCSKGEKSMIDRYARKEISDLFTDQSRFQTYLDVEIACLEGFQQLGRIPESDVLAVKEKAHVDVKRIKEIELVTKHDVVAFTRQISETLGSERKWVHYGLTSTDVVDTALAILYKKADEYIDKGFLGLINAVKDKALAFKDVPCIGRTHGMHSEITSFGLQWAEYYE